MECIAGDSVLLKKKFIQGKLNQHGYHTILQKYAIPFGLCLLGLSFVCFFKWENDRKHTKKRSDGVLHQMT